MDYSFYTADVFTDRLFGGNPLAIFPHAQGLTSLQMQQIASEFNLSETVFILPPQTEQGTRHLRIFTPQTELPFAGHPTVGAAYILALIGEIPLLKEESIIFLEEGVGLVSVKIRSCQGKPVYTELSAAQMPLYSDDIPPIADLAIMLSLNPSDLITAQAVSCGVPFLFIQANSKNALDRVKLQQALWSDLLSQAWASSVYLFTLEPELPSSSVRSRMFAPGLGIVEDPATGSAATALAGFLGSRSRVKDGTLHWQIEQGWEMNRPSLLQVEADITQGEITAIRVGGSSVLVMQGLLKGL